MVLVTTAVSPRGCIRCSDASVDEIDAASIISESECLPRNAAGDMFWEATRDGGEVVRLARSVSEARGERAIGDRCLRDGLPGPVELHARTLDE
eukprot:scaffold39939_cov30-Tisochrysis_lutea.AAC.5